MKGDHYLENNLPCVIFRHYTFLLSRPCTGSSLANDFSVKYRMLRIENGKPAPPTRSRLAWSYYLLTVALYIGSL